MGHAVIIETISSEMSTEGKWSVEIWAIEKTSLQLIKKIDTIFYIYYYIIIINFIFLSFF